MNGRATRFVLLLVFVACALSLTACGGGSKMLKEPIEFDLQQPLAVAEDDNLTATLDWVVVKDGPGTWSKNAWWDEYRLRVVNQSGEALVISSIQVIDSLDTPLTTGLDRKQLVKASKQTSKRYKEYDIEVTPGAGTGTLLAAGTGVFLVGGVAAAASVGAALTQAFTVGATSASTPAIVGVVGTVAVIAAPVLVVGGIVKGANNSKVNKEIISRQVALPMEVAAGETLQMNAFFPVAPSPRSVQLVYETEEGTSILEIRTGDVLRGLHLANPVAADPADTGAADD